MGTEYPMLVSPWKGHYDTYPGYHISMGYVMNWSLPIWFHLLYMVLEMVTYGYRGLRGTPTNSIPTFKRYPLEVL